MSQFGQTVHTNHKYVPVKSDGSNSSQIYPTEDAAQTGSELIVTFQHSQSFKTIFILHDLRKMLD